MTILINNKDDWYVVMVNIFYYFKNLFLFNFEKIQDV